MIKLKKTTKEKINTKINQKHKNKKGKLSARIATLIGTLILISLLIFSTIIVNYTESKLSASTDREIKEISKTNTEKVNTITDVAKTISKNATMALDTFYSQNTSKVKSFNSSITDHKLTKNQFTLESRLINTMWAGLSANENITGIGIFLEDNAIGEGIKNYGPYAYKSNLNSKELTLFNYEDFYNTDYYKSTKATVSPHFSDAYTDQVSGESVISITYPVTDGSNFKGLIIIDLMSTAYNSLDVHIDEFPSLNSSISNQNGSILYNAVIEEEIGSNIQEVLAPEIYEIFKEKSKANETFYVTDDTGSEKYIRYFVPVPVENDIWWLETTVLSKEYNKAVTTMKLILYITVATIVVLVLTVLIVLLKKQLKPLEELDEAAKKMAEGDLNVVIEYDGNDEIGSLAESMKEMTTQVKTVISDITYELTEMANSNFNISSKNANVYIGDYQPLIHSIDTIVSQLSQAMLEIRTASDQVYSGSEQVSSAAQALSQGATEQASSIEELSATMNEISEKIKDTASKADSANAISSIASDEVAVSTEKMNELSSAMIDITEKSHEIGKIIKTIDDIAFQTNILALNAAVEAARAGSAGKGFAVVADEVRNLAQKSAAAAKNTTALIEASILAVENGDKLTNQTAESLGIVAEKVNNVSDIILEISNASETQASGVSQITIGIDQISSVVQTNSATAEESAAASEELSGQANMMNNLINQFKLKE